MAAVVLCAMTLAVSTAAAVADSHEPEPAANGSDDAIQADQERMVEPTPTPLPSDPATGEESQEEKPAPSTDVADNAAAQPVAVRESEAAQACNGTSPPVSPMLAVGGSVGGDVDDSWAALAFLIAGAAAALAAVAFLVRRRKAQPGQRSLLEVASTVVAIVGGLAGLLVQFVPGVGARERPVPEASMEVKDVQPRITRGEFARALQLERPRLGIDRREVGNVVWLQLRLVGYEGKHLRLQWGSHDATKGDALLPETAREMSLRVESGTDVQTRFQPVWVGHPKADRFRVQFRLLDGREVRAIAGTGSMPTLDYRYSCPD